VLDWQRRIVNVQDENRGQIHYQQDEDVHEDPQIDIVDLDE
jgi:hypothetical protein